MRDPMGVSFPLNPIQRLLDLVVSLEEEEPQARRRVLNCLLDDYK